VKNAYRVLVGRLKGRSHLEDQGIEGRIVLEWILGNRLGRYGLDLSIS
jgi:hypothetical protein